jgi:hypothetical protein
MSKEGDQWGHVLGMEERLEFNQTKRAVLYGFGEFLTKKYKKVRKLKVIGYGDDYGSLGYFLGRVGSVHYAAMGDWDEDGIYETNSMAIKKDFDEFIGSLPKEAQEKLRVPADGTEANARYELVNGRMLFEMRYTGDQEYTRWILSSEKRVNKRLVKLN